MILISTLNGISQSVSMRYLLIQVGIMDWMNSTMYNCSAGFPQYWCFPPFYMILEERRGVAAYIIQMKRLPSFKRRMNVGETLI